MGRGGQARRDQGRIAAAARACYFLSAFEGDDAARHALVGPIRHEAPRGQHGQPFAVHLEISNLFGADPLGIPGHVDIGRPLVSFHAVGAGIGNERAQQFGPLRVGLPGLAPLAGQDEEHASLRQERCVAGRLFSHHRPFVAGRLNFDLVGNELPGADNLVTVASEARRCEQASCEHNPISLNIRIAPNWTHAASGTACRPRDPS